MRQLAQELGLSPSAISMALNNKPGISDATREMVTKYIADNSYSVVTNRNSKRGGRINLAIAVLNRGPDISENAFISPLLSNIQFEGEKEGWNVSIRYISGSDLLHFQPQADAVAFLATGMTEEEVRMISNTAYPVVVLDYPAEYISVSSVSLDNRGGIRSAIEYLMENGHRRIGYLKVENCALQNFAERIQEYQSCLAQYGLGQGDIIALPGNLNMACAKMNQWLHANKLSSTALITDTDFITCGAVTAFENNGIQVGRDVSLICFDNTIYAETANLTAISISYEHFAHMCIRQVISLLEHPEWPYTHYHVGTELVIRSSVGRIQ